MDIATHLDILRADGELLARTAERTGLDAQVPTCPDWRVRDLLGHLGGVHRWAAYIVESRSAVRPSREDSTALFRAPGDDELLDWYRAMHAELLKTLAAGSPDAPAWTLFDAPNPLAFWARRQAHETAIHRVDTELAAGVPSIVSAEFAADGIDELLSGFLSVPRRNVVADPPLSITIAPDDAPLAWTMRIKPDDREVIAHLEPTKATEATKTTSPADSAERAESADLIVSGPAETLYLLVWNRADATGCRLEGDPEVLARWRDLTKVP
ncbi:maleylpyruvate isomerase family mycothiol-dependent enzyme [Embleya sp. AB8]|uniref:maleylpyruvate isomerase family mycothiol-dependent enzyme n=1 Tax=Embleya sp. AB8 TaxID=3156304 RepID=UPI003C71ACD7